MKKILLAALAFGAASQSYDLKAQNYVDVLRYSQKNVQSTARSVGIGGAFGAVGADFSTLSINPAGLGLYRRQEFSFTPGINKQSSTADYLGSTAGDDKYNFAIHNLGLVLSDVKTKLGKPVQDGWVAVNFGIGFNRTNNFHSNVAVEGKNSSNSITQSWAQLGEGYKPSTLSEFSYPFLAWKTYLLDPANTDTTSYISPYDEYDSGHVNLLQSDYISTRGSMNDIVLTVAGNYSNKLYLGAGLMFPTVGYHYTRQFTETNLNAQSQSFIKSAYLLENINTSGIGISMNGGLIYRVNDNIRLGGSVQLPVFYSMTDDYNYSMKSTIMDGRQFDAATPSGRFKYSIVTPMRGTVSASYIFGKSGFISADYERINYSAGRINTDYEGSRDENNMVRMVYQNTGNLRIGGEYVYQNFAVRAGYQMLGSPFKSAYVPEGYSGTGRILSFGLGFKDADYSLDLGYQYQTDKYFYLPYAITTKTVEGANVTNSRGSVLITLASKF